MKIQKLLDSAGPSIVDVSVTWNGVTEDFKMRRLPYLEFDRIRNTGLGVDGKYDPARATGINGRYLAPALIDEGDQQYDANEINQWPPGLVLALMQEFSKVNAFDVTTRDQAAKN